MGMSLVDEYGELHGCDARAPRADRIKFVPLHICRTSAFLSAVFVECAGGRGGGKLN